MRFKNMKLFGIDLCFHGFGYFNFLNSLCALRSSSLVLSKGILGLSG